MAGATKLMTSGGGGVNITPSSSIAADVTVNVPSQNCTLGIQGPAFSAYQSTQQTGISAGVFTKVNLQTEEFDTNSCFDTGTSTFTPNVAGVYQVNCTVWCRSGATIIGGFVNLWKNGSWFKDGSFHNSYGNPQNEFGSTLSTLVYMNGTTDYLQMYVWGNVTSGTFDLYTPYNQNRLHFSACLVRAVS